MAGNSRIQINFEKIYQSNENGPFKIIEDLGRDDHSRLWVKIKFLETGTEKVVRYDIACDGRVRDELYGIDFNKTYISTYSGPYNIVAYKGMSENGCGKIVTVKFANTGFEYDVALKSAQKGIVADKSLTRDQKYIPSDIDRETHDEIIKRILYGRWARMMDRCYNPKSNAYYKYGAIGVTVDPYWHRVENYLLTVPLIRNYSKFYRNPAAYNIDKDFLQFNIPREKRVYSMHTCVFLSAQDNANLATLETHVEGEFFGVKQVAKNKWIVQFMMGNERHNFGAYSNIIAAANAYNYFYFQFGGWELVPLINKVQYMSIEEVEKYRIW